MVQSLCEFMFAKGLSKYDLMTIAGHAKFDTTHQFYLAVEDNLVGKIMEQFDDIWRGSHCQDCK